MQHAPDYTATLGPRVSTGMTSTGEYALSGSLYYTSKIFMALRAPSSCSPLTSRSTCAPNGRIRPKNTMSLCSAQTSPTIATGTRSSTTASASVRGGARPRFGVLSLARNTRKPIGASPQCWATRQCPSRSVRVGNGSKTDGLGVFASGSVGGIRTRRYHALLLLAACFINDLLTVLALGFIFSPFTWKTGAFFGGASLVFAVMPLITPPFFKRYGGRPSELEAKFLLLVLSCLGGLATWSGSEAVLPAYLVGMVLAGSVGKDHALIRRLRTLTFGLLTPFYFHQSRFKTHVTVVRQPI